MCVKSKLLHFINYVTLRTLYLDFRNLIILTTFNQYNRCVIKVLFQEKMENNDENVTHTLLFNWHFVNVRFAFSNFQMIENNLFFPQIFVRFLFWITAYWIIYISLCTKSIASIFVHDVICCTIVSTKKICCIDESTRFSIRNCLIDYSLFFFFNHFDDWFGFNLFIRLRSREKRLTTLFI